MASQKETQNLNLTQATGFVDLFYLNFQGNGMLYT